MTIQELINKLQQYPDKDMEVVVFDPFAFNEDRPHYSSGNLYNLNVVEKGSSFSFPKSNEQTVNVLLVAV